MQLFEVELVLMSRRFGARTEVSPDDDHGARKRARLSHQEIADDDFPDGDFTAEEFDFCLTQVADVSSKPLGSVPGPSFNVPPTKDARYSLEGQVQILNRKVASLSKELHCERLSKHDELKAQADSHSKALTDLKAQIEFKDGELRSALGKQAAFEEKLRSRGFETRLKQVADGATSTDTGLYPDDAGECKEKVKESVVSLPSLKDVIWLSPQYGLHLPLLQKNKQGHLTHWNIIRDYVARSQDTKQDKHLSASTDAVVLSLHSLTNAISELALETEVVSPSDRISVSSNVHSETFLFDTIAKLCQDSDTRVVSESAALLKCLMESSKQACTCMLKYPQIPFLLLEKSVISSALQLLRAALYSGSLSHLCCPAVTQTPCLWMMLAKHFDKDVSEDLLCEGALLVQHASCSSRNSCSCFHNLVKKLAERCKKVFERSKGETPRAALLLDCFCSVARAFARHKQQFCSLLDLSNIPAEQFSQSWTYSDVNSPSISGL